MTARDLHATDLAGAAQHTANNGHYHYHNTRTYAAEQGVTESDIPTGGDPDPALVASFAANLPDPFLSVACGVCGVLIAASDVTAHVVACAGSEVA